MVMAAVDGGVTMVQYRNKSGNMPEIHMHCALLAELLKGRGVAFLVNDHIDVAFASGATGVHLGQGDASPQEAREKLGEAAIIGLTAFTPEHMAAIDAQVVDYVGTGPFYPTQTDKGKPVMGAEKFAEIAGLSPVPVVGIGGITPENAHAVMAAGANGLAMMRAISEADDVKRAARSFLEALS